MNLNPLIWNGEKCINWIVCFVFCFHMHGSLVKKEKEKRLKLAGTFLNGFLFLSTHISEFQVEEEQ